MAVVGITVQGVTGIERSLRSTSRRAQDVRPAFRVIRRDFRSIMVKQFDSEGRYLGKPWATLTPATEERKARFGGDQRILHQTRRLRKSFTTGQEGVYVATRSELELGSAVPYSGVVSDGTSHQVERPIFTFNRATSRRWSKIISSYIAHGVAEVPPL